MIQEQKPNIQNYICTTAGSRLIVALFYPEYMSSVTEQWNLPFQTLVKLPKFSLASISFTERSRTERDTLEFFQL